MFQEMRVDLSARILLVDILWKIEDLLSSLQRCLFADLEAPVCSFGTKHRQDSWFLFNHKYWL